MISRQDSFCGVIARRMESLGDREAFTFLANGEEPSVRISYGDLAVRTMGVSGCLREETQVGDRVLLLYPSGIDFIVAFLACLFTGRFAVPIYLPREGRGFERLKSILANAQPNLVLTSLELESRVGRGLADLQFEGPLICTDQWQRFGSCSITDFCFDNPERIAFLQYTSGSTGDPKGVMVTDRNLLDNQERIKDAFAQNESSTILSWLPLYHDMGLIGCVLHPLFLGARAVLMSPASFIEKPARWLQAISRFHGTISGGPNFAFEHCCSAGESELEGLNLSSWEVAFCGSETVRPQTLAKFIERFEPLGFSRQALSPCYGLAEATLMVSACRHRETPVILRGKFVDFASVDALKRKFESDNTLPELPVSVGKINPDEVFILDEQGNLLTESVVGRIFVSNGSVSKGYWNNEILTKTVFRSHKGSNGIDTGDLGFIFAGELFIAGRIRDLIIIRGRNIDPDDVETIALSVHPELAGCRAAAFSSDGEMGESLWLVLEVPLVVRFDYEAVLARVQESLDVKLEVRAERILLIRRGTIPKTSSGKVRRNRCKEIAFSEAFKEIVPVQRRDLAGSGMGVSIASKSELEKRFESAVADFFGRAAVDSNESLFALGLDSLKTVQLAAKLTESLGIPIAGEMLFQHKTIGTLIDAISESSARKVDERANHLRGTTAKRSEASPIQHAIYLDCERSNDSSAYNIPVLVRADTDLKLSDNAVDVCLTLRRAIYLLIEGNSILRTSFKVKSGILVHEVDAAFELKIDEFHCLNDEEMEVKLRELSKTSFVLQRTPLIRCALFTVDNSVVYLFMVVHHLIADGFSVGLMLREVVRSAGGGASRESFLEYAAAWELPSETLAEEPPKRLSLPTDCVLGDQADRSSAHVGLTLPQSLNGCMERWAHENSTTPFTAFLAAFALFMHRVTGEVEIEVGVQTSGRNSDALLDVIGPMVQPITICAAFGEKSTFWDVVESLGIQLRDRSRYRAKSQAPVPNIFVNGLEMLDDAFGIHSQEVFRWDLIGRCNFEVNCYFGRFANSRAIHLQYRTNQFIGSTMEYWIRAIGESLHFGIAHAKEPLSSFRLP